MDIDRWCITEVSHLLKYRLLFSLADTFTYAPILQPFIWDYLGWEQ